MEYNCVLIKVDWLAACIALRVVVGAVLVVFLLRWHKISTTIQWKERQIPEEMSKTLLTNKKQGNLHAVHAAIIINGTVAPD